MPNNFKIKQLAGQGNAKANAIDSAFDDLYDACVNTTISASNLLMILTQLKEVHKIVFDALNEAYGNRFYG